jgi:hypothetical protein
MQVEAESNTRKMRANRVCGGASATFDANLHHLFTLGSHLPRWSAGTFFGAVRELLGGDTSLQVDAHQATIDVLNEQIERLKEQMKAAAEASEPRRAHTQDQRSRADRLARFLAAIAAVGAFGVLELLRPVRQPTDLKAVLRGKRGRA